MLIVLKKWVYGNWTKREKKTYTFIYNNSEAIFGKSKLKYYLNSFVWIGGSINSWYDYT